MREIVYLLLLVPLAASLASQRLVRSTRDRLGSFLALLLIAAAMCRYALDSGVVLVVPL